MRQDLRKRVLVTALLAFFLPSLSAQQKPVGAIATRYRIQELPLRPLAINESDWVAGATEDQHAAIWNAKSGLFQIPLRAEFTFSEATGINQRGEAVGTASNADYTRRIAFLVRQHKVEVLPGNQSRANSINDLGGIAGQSIVPGTKTITPVVWKNGEAIDLRICCAGSARAISGNGMVSGDTYDKVGHYHAFLWDVDHGARLITIPGEEYSSVIATNSAGDVLLKSTPGGVLLYSGGQLEPMDLAKGMPRAINRDRVVVGSVGAGPEAQRAFVWDQGHGLRDLNTLIPAGSNWTLEVASGINDRGEIVGWGDRDDEENVGFLLIPIEEKKKPEQSNGTAMKK